MEITLGPLGITWKGNGHGAALVSQYGSALEEAVDRGNVYATANQTTVTTQAGLSVTTPALTIANRNGSRQLVKLWYVSCTSLVAAGAAAAIFAALGRRHSTAVIETAAATTANMKTGDASAPPGVPCLSVATLPAAPVAVGILGAQTSAAISTSPVGSFFERWYNGALFIDEGCNFSLQTSTASTLFCEYIFEVVATR